MALLLATAMCASSISVGAAAEGGKDAAETMENGEAGEKSAEATAEDLNALGITDEKLENSASRITGQGEKLLNGEELTVDGNAIQYVSGVGLYTTTFNCDEDVKDAVIKFSHEDSSVESDARVNGDMVTKVTITNANGTFTFTGINQVSDTLDIGDVLAQGENTIEVKLVTTLRNREWIEGAATGPMFNKMQNYGLTGLSINW